jgi:hypothetical protein
MWRHFRVFVFGLAFASIAVGFAYAVPRAIMTIDEAAERRAREVEREPLRPPEPAAVSPSPEIVGGKDESLFSGKDKDESKTDRRSKRGMGKDKPKAKGPKSPKGPPSPPDHAKQDKGAKPPAPPGQEKAPPPSGGKDNEPGPPASPGGGGGGGSPPKEPKEDKAPGGKGQSSKPPEPSKP